MWIKVIIFFNTLVSFVHLQISESCLSDNNCTEILNCEPALRQLKAKRSHDFEVCGYAGIIQLVCCPISGNTIGNSIKRECEKFKAVATLDLRILGGEAASISEFPHMVGLGFDLEDGYVFDCGGSVVSTTYVITAAHCVKGRNRIPPSIVRGGVIEIGKKEWNSDTDTRIAQIIPHPQYNPQQKYHDLALLRLATPLKISSNLNFICLETSYEDPNIPLTVTGWGKISSETGNRSATLLKANVIAVPRETCVQSFSSWDWQRKLPNGIIAGQICAGDPKGFSGTCQGDSGGPLSITLEEGLNRLVGVTSFGRGCGSRLPTLFTRVSYYLDWIESVVWPN